MKNFARVLRMALRYRWTLAASLCCSLMIGMLWGVNISVTFPFVELLVQNKTVDEWMGEKIATSEKTIAGIDAAILPLQDQIAAASDTATREELQNELHLAEANRENEAHALEYWQWLAPVLKDWLPTTAFGTLVAVVSALWIGTLLKNVFVVLHLNLVERLQQRTAFDLRKLFFRRTMRMEISAFQQEHAAALTSRITGDVDGVASGIENVFGKAIREPLKMIACFVGASLICWRLLLFSLIVAPISAVLMKMLSKSIKRANRKAMEGMSKLGAMLVEIFGGVQAVKSFTMEQHERKRVHQCSKEYMQKAQRITFYNALTKPATEMMGVAVICLAILAGAYLVMNKETSLLGIPMTDRPLSLGALLTFFAMMVGVSDPARRLSDIYSGVQRGAAAADRVFEVLDREPTIKDPAKPKRVPAQIREVVFDRVTFSYTSNQPVLVDFSLRIKAGTTLAVVGPNGCGKTTLVNLLPRFYDPQGGTIRLNDVELREVRQNDLRRRIGLVTQHTQLFDDTILNNIRYGTPHASDAEVIEASKKAHAHRFIEEKMSEGYQTFVGQGGNRLSGGQRQRIALARAILRDPEILILDEATSQIDIESEQLIHKVLEQFVRNRTTIMITHRLSTLALADQILVMDAGQKLDLGTHEELFRRCDLYRRLHDIQFRQTA